MPKAGGRSTAASRAAQAAAQPSAEAEVEPEPEAQGGQLDRLEEGLGRILGVLEVQRQGLADNQSALARAEAQNVDLLARISALEAGGAPAPAPVAAAAAAAAPAGAAAAAAAPALSAREVALEKLFEYLSAKCEGFANNHGLDASIDPFFKSIILKFEKESQTAAFKEMSKSAGASLAGQTPTKPKPRKPSGGAKAPAGEGG
eukprot:SAG11_NODE_2720_length_3046_cov_40.638955_2_plen_203_part_00